MIYSSIVKTERLPTFRNFLIVALISTCFILFYWLFNACTGSLRSSSVLLSRALLDKNRNNECKLSWFESEGWFCESEKDWKRRKALHYLQHKRNRQSNARMIFFQNNWEPTIQCEFERRLGNTGDGGKWVCDIHRYREINDSKLLIYSFGSHGDFSFEHAIKEQLPESEIHTFDLGIYQCPERVCTFHQARLGNGRTPQSKSLRTLIKELGHEGRKIQILKVDIEGSEFDLFEELFDTSIPNRTAVPFIRQILFEIHLGGGRDEGPSGRTHNLFELFHKNHYAIFHKEVNLYDPQNVFEYALLRLNPAFFIPSNDSF